MPHSHRSTTVSPPADGEHQGGLWSSGGHRTLQFRGRPSWPSRPSHCTSRALANSTRPSHQQREKPHCRNHFPLARFTPQKVSHRGPSGPGSRVQTMACVIRYILQFAHQRGSLKFRRDLSAQHNPQQSSDPQWGMPTSLDINSKSPLQYNNIAVKNLSPSTARGDPTAPSSMLPSGPTCGQQPASNARNDQNNCFHATLLSLLSAVSFTYENAK